MELELLLKGILIGFMISVPLGPIGVLCVQRTLNKGRLSGFVSGLGAAGADTVFALLSGFGISIIIQFVEDQQIYFQIIGGAIILVLGVNIFYSNPIKQIRMQRLNRNKLSQDFFSVFLLTLSNPMAIFFFLAMFTGVNLASGTMSYFNLFIMVAGVTMGSSLWWFLLSTVVSLFRHRFRLKNIWWMNKIAGVIIFFLGIAAILSVWIL
jgi:threonine/homoserine/homoserine lactone efflux protein